MPSTRVAIVGGGVAGVTAALCLERTGVEVTLFEQKESLVSGPPFCHLHAGGNLYREISDEQCITLLEQSIDLLRFYPYAIDFRPTVIVVPQNDPGAPEALFPRLQKLQSHYRQLIQKDPENRVLGDADHYYKAYDKAELEQLCQQEPVAKPATFDEWLIPLVQEMDLEQIKYPVIIVQEYGLNLFRLGAGATLALNEAKGCRLELNTTVNSIQPLRNDEGFSLTVEHQGEARIEQFDYLINAAGFRTGMIDDMLGFKRDRLVEFKAAYVTQWQQDSAWPEVIFHGERGTPMGMAQFTPYPGGYIQLHGMTEEITLFEGGLVRSSPQSAQPKLDARFLDMIDQKWEWSCVETRSRRAIEHMARYIPAFRSAKIASIPLYGAQQIPGDDPTLRAADVTFEGARYARCEVVKASSVLTMTDAIIASMKTSGLLNKTLPEAIRIAHAPDSGRLEAQAAAACEARGYPIPLSQLIVPISA